MHDSIIVTIIICDSFSSLLSPEYDMITCIVNRHIALISIIGGKSTE